MTKLIKERISSFSSGNTDSIPERRCAERQRRQTSSRASLSQAVSAKLEDGNVRAVIRILMSQDSPAAPSPESVSALREKHPGASSDLSQLPHRSLISVSLSTKLRFGEPFFLFQPALQEDLTAYVLNTFETC